MSLSLTTISLASVISVDDFTKGRMFQIAKQFEKIKENTDYITVAQKYILASQKAGIKTNGWDTFFPCPDSWLSFDPGDKHYLTYFYLGRLFQFILLTDKDIKSAHILTWPVPVMLDTAINIKVKFMPQRIDKCYDFDFDNDDYQDPSPYVGRRLKCMDCGHIFDCNIQNVLAKWDDENCNTCHGGFDFLDY